jgi:hypothetical protein
MEEKKRKETEKTCYLVLTICFKKTSEEKRRLTDSVNEQDIQYFDG